MQRSHAGRLAVLLAFLLVFGGFLVAGPVFAHPEHCATKSGEEGEDTEGICLTEEEIASFDDSGANLQPGQIGRTQNLHLLATLPRTGVLALPGGVNSDIAFWDKYAIQGNYNGLQITDITAPGNPKLVSQINCPGAQNDVSVWENLIFASVDSSRTFGECERNGVLNGAQSAQNPNSWEGIRIFDWSDPANPTFVTSVETDCGSHTHTLVPDLDNNRALIYVSSYSPNAAFPDCRPPHDKISIVEVPLANPAAASVISEPVLFPDGGFPGAPAIPGRPARGATSGCHDITVYPEIGLAAGACMGQGVIMDISDPAAPVVLSNIFDVQNFAFWHSATFSNDGTKVIFTDELGGGTGPTCNPTIGPERGANAIYDISDPTKPVLLSYYKIGRTQANTENCVAHNGIVLPTPDRDLFVQSWYQGGVSVMDFTDPENPVELAFFDRGPLSTTSLVTGGSWSTYFYNGFIYSNDIVQGLDLLRLSDPAAAKANGVKMPYLNAQTQESIK